MSFILFFLFIVFLVVAVALSIGASFLRILFGRPNDKRSKKRQQYDQSGHSHSKSSQHQKVFSKDEGEYVDFEEVE